MPTSDALGTSPSPASTPRFTITVKQVAVAVVSLVVATFLLIAVLATRTVETPAIADTTEFSIGSPVAEGDVATYTSRAATVQTLAGFGLLSIWIIGGTVMFARAQGNRTLSFG